METGELADKDGSNDCVISIFRPRHRKRLPIARKFSAIWGAWMKLVNFRMKEGKRTRVRAIVYQTFHRPARTERDVIKLMVDAIENIKPICEVEKVGVAGTIYDVPGIVARDRQQTLAIRWILEAAFKRRISYRISLEKCSFAEILDAYRKRGIARKKRENLHGLASTIEVSRISDGGKVRPHKELFLIQSNEGDQSKKEAMNEEVVGLSPSFFRLTRGADLINALQREGS
uniref:Small ribosomal subunit protein uS7 domain-containing protein n=1 Tax=Salix viminalis TaxID=40686 RepID=A0A6N2MUG8_SALVM